MPHHFELCDQGVACPVLVPSVCRGAGSIFILLLFFLLFIVICDVF